MSTFDSYRLLITPLSPIHIGTGESYEPTNYIIEDGILHEFDTGSAVDALTVADRKALLDISNRRPDSEMIKSVQKYFHSRREQLIPWAVNRIPVLPGVANLYADRIGQTANQEATGRQVLNRLEIDRTSYNPITRLPVLFGSSLKGAIRTALLDDINKGAGLQKVEDRRTGKRRDENNQELQWRLFLYQAGKFELDPMRLVQLSDAAWQGEPGLPAAQVHLAVNRKKEPIVDKQGNLRKSSVESGNGPDQILECIPGWRYRAFAGQINLQSVAGMTDQGKQGQRRVPAEVLRFNLAKIARACNDFYNPILGSEIQIMRSHDYLDEAWCTAIDNFLKINEEPMKNGKVFLLRVGRHSGAESVTLNGVRKIKIMQGRDPETGRNRSAEETEARTLWLAANTKDQATNLLPFGWLLVETQPMDAPIQDWPELKSACEPHLTNARAFAAQLATKKAEIEQARQIAETKRRTEEEQARQLVEEETRAAQAEAERQARIAAMTPEQREIEDFRKIFETARNKGPYNASDNVFNECRLKLFRSAIGWSDTETRRQAGALLRECISWSGWPGNKDRKAEFRTWLEKLEGEA